MKRYSLFFSLLLLAVAQTVAQSFTVNLKDGQSVTFNCEDVLNVAFTDTTAITPEPEPEPQAPAHIGDFYYADGTWSTELRADKTPVGIVFFAGEASAYGDRAAYYRQKDGNTRMGEIHGYAVALRDATYFDGEHHGVWWSAFMGGDRGCGCSTATDDFMGYTNTLSILERANSEGGLSASDKSFPAAYYATAYEQTCPAPEQSSGWFFPSAGQLNYIWSRAYFDDDNSGRACLENSFKTLGEEVAMPLYCSDSEYWTSTEQVDSYGASTWAYYFNFDERSFSPGFIANYRKNANMRVRSILVF